MQNKNITFEHALERAQDLGYAETIDPSADIDGHDAARKIAILASLIYGYHLPVERVKTEGIRDISHADFELAERLNGTIKLLASAQGETYFQSRITVRPTFVFNTNPFAAIDDVNNMISLSCNLSGNVSLYGRGAGKLPTAAVMVGDMIELVTKEISKPPLWSDALETTAVVEEQPLKYFVTVHSDNKRIISRLVEQVEASTTTDNSAAFFTSRIVSSEAQRLKKRLQSHSVKVKLFEVVEE